MKVAPRRTADSYLQQNCERNRKRASILLVSGILLILLAVILLVTISAPWPIILIVLGLVCLWISRNYFEIAFNYSAGIEGENAVVEALQVLDDNYYLINDVIKTGWGGNIDHVLLGPHAIFAIETKNYSGDIRCDGDQWRKKGRRRLYTIDSASKQARGNAKYLSSLIQEKTDLRIFVTPICVFTNPYSSLKLRKPTVNVLRLDELVTFIRETKSSTRLSESQMQVVAQCILEEPTEKIEDSKND